MKCSKCKREYQRKYCEFCSKKVKWNENGKTSFILRKFPPRIAKDLLSLNLPPVDFIESTYLYGPTKSGKTITAGSQLVQTKKQNYIEGVDASYCFINVSILLAEIKDTYSSSTITESEVIKKYVAYDYLVLDDLGAERTTDWVLQVLYIIINQRYEWFKPIIVTSNYSLAQLVDKLGDDRIPSRLDRICKKIKLTKKY